MTLWLALDIGTTGTKAALLDASGQVQRSAYRDYATYTAEGGIVEQDARDWWNAAAAAARELDPMEADAIALTGQMQNVILLDAQGVPVRPVILYSDSQYRGWSQEFGPGSYASLRIGNDALSSMIIPSGYRVTV
ncbi:MAG: hypothetical protein JNM70_23735, partial [Anaerolineae bacterium]|nr:hypothetical protein [Anaerolineae bacterium]